MGYVFGDADTQSRYVLNQEIFVVKWVMATGACGPFYNLKKKEARLRYEAWSRSLPQSRVS